MIDSSAACGWEGSLRREPAPATEFAGGGRLDSIGCRELLEEEDVACRVVLDHRVLAKTGVGAEHCESIEGEERCAKERRGDKRDRRGNMEDGDGNKRINRKEMCCGHERKMKEK